MTTSPVLELLASEATKTVSFTCSHDNPHMEDIVSSLAPGEILLADCLVMDNQLHLVVKGNNGNDSKTSWSLDKLKTGCDNPMILILNEKPSRVLDKALNSLKTSGFPDQILLFSPYGKTVKYIRKRFPSLPRPVSLSGILWMLFLYRAGIKPRVPQKSDLVIIPNWMGGSRVIPQGFIENLLAAGKPVIIPPPDDTLVRKTLLHQKGLYIVETRVLE